MAIGVACARWRGEPFRPAFLADKPQARVDGEVHAPPLCMAAAWPSGFENRVCLAAALEGVERIGFQVECPTLALFQVSTRSARLVARSASAITAVKSPS